MPPFFDPPMPPSSTKKNHTENSITHYFQDPPQRISVALLRLQGTHLSLTTPLRFTPDARNRPPRLVRRLGLRRLRTPRKQNF